MATTGLKFHEICIEESGVDRALVDLLEKQATWTDEPKLKCYIQCQGSKAEVFDENGVINVDTVQKVLKATNQKFLDMVNSECKHPQHPQLCEAAFITSICIADILYGHHHLH